MKYSIEDYYQVIQGYDPKCDMCNTDLTNQPIQHYDHAGGWPVKGFLNNQWLYITCPKCKYQWALWKLGLPRHMRVVQ